MTHAVFIRVVIITGLYLGLYYFGGLAGWRILYPIRLFVTFLHEFGHAAGALITGGDVHHIRIDPNAGGVTQTSGGVRAVTIMGGYLGSALFGNALVYIGARRENWIKPTLGIVIFAMMITGLVWFNSVFTTALMFIFSIGLFWIGFKTKYGRDVLTILGIASVLYILQDTGRGPSSDLQAFEAEMFLIPAVIWKYIWLAIALGILALNLKQIFSVTNTPKPEKSSPT